MTRADRASIATAAIMIAAFATWLLHMAGVIV